MKKRIGIAIFLSVWGLYGCYTPLNNSGVATTKKWLEVSAKKTDFDGKQYDSCYQFKLRFWPPQAAERIDLEEACISACCWRSDKETVVLNFNKNTARGSGAEDSYEYSPDKITLTVRHVPLLNTTRVKVSPAGAVTSDGLVKLSYRVPKNSARSAAEDVFSLDRQAQTAQTKADETTAQAATTRTVLPSAPALEAHNLNAAARLVRRVAGQQIDEHFYRMNKNYVKQGTVFVLGERTFRAEPDGGNLYTVSCTASVRTGADAAHLHEMNFPCGQWRTDVSAQSVFPLDKLAETIWEGE